MVKKIEKGIMGIRDLLVFFAFSGFVGITFVLQEYPNAEFFGLLIAVFIGLLLWVRHYHKEHQFSGLLDYDENLNFSGMLYVVGGALGMYVVSSLLISALAQSSIYVPYRGIAVTIGTFQLEGFWNDFLFNITLVAPAEELVKLVLHLVLFLKFYNPVKKYSMFNEPTARALAIGLPVAGWSVLHAYSAYTGPNMLVLLLAAAVGGVIIFGVMKVTKSLIGAILTHAFYNCIVIYIASLNGISFALSPELIKWYLFVMGLIYLGVSLHGKWKTKKEAIHLCSGS